MHRGVLIGAGGFGAAWDRTFLSHFRNRLQMVGIADIDPGALDRAGDALAVPPEWRSRSYEVLLDEVDADICFIVLPPAIRPAAVRAAARRGLAVLCEKPMAASWEQTLEIGQILHETGIRFAVIQNYREQSRIRALKQVLQRPGLRNVNLVECRFAANYTIDTAGGAFRHQIPDAFIYEGAEHHLDQLRHLTGADGDWVAGVQWGQPWSTFGGTTCLSLIIRMTNGVMVHYEMNHVERGQQHGWHREYYRFSTEGGSVTLDQDDIIRVVRDTPGGESVEEIMRETSGPEDHFAVIGSFLDWIDGGAPAVSVYEDNIRTMALTFAAVDATHTGGRVDVQELLASAVRQVPGLAGA